MRSLLSVQYYGVTASDDIIVWFWTLVASLKQEEKALLLKFSTGSPNVPAGGFSQLHGLSGPTLFNITLISGKDKVRSGKSLGRINNYSDFCYGVAWLN